MLIKKITQNEFEQVQSLIKKEFPYVGVTDKKLENRLSQENTFIFTGHIKNKLVGFIDVSLFANFGMINGFCVNEKNRKLGIGTNLLGFGINFLKESGVQKIKLLVKKDNSTARKMYEQEGFTFLRVHPKKINDSEVEEMILESSDPLNKIFEKFVT